MRNVILARKRGIFQNFRNNFRTHTVTQSPPLTCRKRICKVSYSCQFIAGIGVDCLLKSQVNWSSWRRTNQSFELWNRYTHRNCHISCFVRIYDKWEWARQIECEIERFFHVPQPKSNRKNCDTRPKETQMNLEVEAACLTPLGYFLTQEYHRESHWYQCYVQKENDRNEFSGGQRLARGKSVCIGWSACCRWMHLLTPPQERLNKAKCLPNRRNLSRHKVGFFVSVFALPSWR